MWCILFEPHIVVYEGEIEPPPKLIVGLVAVQGCSFVNDLWGQTKAHACSNVGLRNCERRGMGSLVGGLSDVAFTRCGHGHGSRCRCRRVGV